MIDERRLLFVSSLFVPITQMPLPSGNSLRTKPVSSAMVFKERFLWFSFEFILHYPVLQQGQRDAFRVARHAAYCAVNSQLHLPLISRFNFVPIDERIWKRANSVVNRESLENDPFIVSC